MVTTIQNKNGDRRLPKVIPSETESNPVALP